MENGTFVFQFHKGTIRTAGTGDVTIKAPTFQFHKGTIRTCGSQG